MRPEPFRLERFFAEHEFTVPHLLCASDCESLSLGELLALAPGAARSFEALRLGYTESSGSLPLREAVAALHRSLGAEHVLVHSGAQEAILCFFQAVVEKGDRVVVHSPHYQSLGEIPRALGAQVLEWRARPSQAHALDLEELKSQVRERTRAVVVNFPHNPTGHLPDRAFVRDLLALADRHGFLVFSDEVYRGLEHRPEDRLPALADESERAVSLGVLSKTYGLAGLRIGWVAARDRDLLRRMAAAKDYATICSAAPSEFLATIALRHHEELAARNRSIAVANLALLRDFFQRREDRFAFVPPRAGPIAYPALRTGSVDEYCAKLREEAGVLLLPGTLFEPGSTSFRVGFGRANFAEGLARWEEFEAGLRT